MPSVNDVQAYMELLCPVSQQDIFLSYTEDTLLKQYFSGYWEPGFEESQGLWNMFGTRIV